MPTHEERLIETQQQLAEARATLAVLEAANDDAQALRDARLRVRSLEREVGNIRKAIEIPTEHNPTMMKVSATMPPELYERTRAALADDETFSGKLRELLEAWLREAGKE